MSRPMICLHLDPVVCTAALHPDDNAGAGAAVMLSARAARLHEAWAFSPLANSPEFERRIGAERLVDCHTALSMPYERIRYLTALFGAVAELTGAADRANTDLRVLLPLSLAALDLGGKETLNVDDLLPSSMLRDIELAGKLAGLANVMVERAAQMIPIDPAWLELLPIARNERYGCMVELGANAIGLIPFQFVAVGEAHAIRLIGSPLLIPLGSAETTINDSLLLEGLRSAVDRNGVEGPLVDEVVRGMLQRACGIPASEFLGLGSRNRLQRDAMPIKPQQFEAWLIKALMSTMTEDDLLAQQLINRLTGAATNEIWVVALSGAAARVVGVDQALGSQFCGVERDDRGVKPGCLWSGNMLPDELVTCATAAGMDVIVQAAAPASAKEPAAEHGIGRLTRIEVEATNVATAGQPSMADVSSKTRPHLTRCTAFWSGGKNSDVSFEIRLYRPDGAASKFSVDVTLNHWEHGQAVELEARVDRFDRVTVSIMVGGTRSPAIVKAKPDQQPAVADEQPEGQTQIRVQERDLGEFILFVDEVHRHLCDFVGTPESRGISHKIFQPTAYAV
jgi:hypothetical protein